MPCRIPVKPERAPRILNQIANQRIEIFDNFPFAARRLNAPNVGYDDRMIAIKRSKQISDRHNNWNVLATRELLPLLLFRFLSRSAGKFF